jgi:hypothetical protein
VAMLCLEAEMSLRWRWLFEVEVADVFSFGNENLKPQWMSCGPRSCTCWLLNWLGGTSC